MALNGAFNLPTEIWCNIFWYLDKTSKKNSTATCQFWYEVIRNDRKLSGYIALDLEKWPDLDINSILGGKWLALEILEFKHSMAIANLKKSEDFVTNITTPSKYIHRRTEISIN